MISCYSTYQGRIGQEVSATSHLSSRCAWKMKKAHESDGLKTNEVISAGDGGRDSSGPRAVLVNHLPITPLAVADSSADQTALV